MGPIHAQLRQKRHHPDVSFGYPGARPLLRGVNLEINPGETVALVGRSGSGKTTLLNLLLHFCEPDTGRILLDGVDLREMASGHLRGAIALVPQENLLFSVSVADNIRCGKPNATMEEVVHTARLAHAHEFIEALPRGHETVLGERGEGLSVGQKQRLGIARALLREPKVLILDEATSSIDAISERLIHDAVAEAAKTRTCILVAHHVSAVRIADRVVSVDEDGGVREIGFEGLRRDLTPPAVKACATPPTPSRAATG